MSQRLFGHQLDFVAKVVNAKRQPLDAGVDSTEAQQRAQLAQQYSRMIMQMLVSAAILALSTWLLVRDNNEQLHKAAFGFIGTVIGYWLR